jgi:Mrp family chromosome partitioning ATPase
MTNWTPGDIDFEILRGSIEQSLSAPGVVAICSASHADGKSLTAFGLTATLAQAGHRSLLLDANLTNPALTTVRENGLRYELIGERVFNDPVTGVDVISFASAGPTGGREHTPSTKQLRVLLATLRARYDFIVVDTERIPASRTALQLAGLADGVILVCRAGRMPTGDDQYMVRALDNAHARVIGVVTATAGSIKQFSTRIRLAPEPTRIIRESSVSAQDGSLPHRVVKGATT